MKKLLFIFIFSLLAFCTTNAYASEEADVVEEFTMLPGEIKTVSYTVPEHDMKWSSSNKKIVKIKKVKGEKNHIVKLEALKKGTAVITGEYGDKILEINITVRNVKATIKDNKNGQLVINMTYNKKFKPSVKLSKPKYFKKVSDKKSGSKVIKRKVVYTAKKKGKSKVEIKFGDDLYKTWTITNEGTTVVHIGKKPTTNANSTLSTPNTVSSTKLSYSESDNSTTLKR